MNLREGLGALVMLVAVLAGVYLLWEFGHSHAARTDSGGPLTWAYTVSAFPLGWGTYRAARRLPRHVAAGLVVATLLLSAGVAAVIAVATGTLVDRTAIGFPFYGASFGWQMTALLRR